MIEPKVLDDSMPKGAGSGSPFCAECRKERSRGIDYCCGCGARLDRLSAPPRYSVAIDSAAGFSLGIVTPVCLMTLAFIGLYTVGRWLIDAIWGPKGIRLG